MKNTVHLLSGGFDSVTLLYALRSEGCAVHALMVDYGQQHVQELECGHLACRRMSVPFTRITLPPLNGLTEAEKWIVPNRNAILISHAVNLALQLAYESVSIGCNANDAENFPDCRMGFLEAINETVKQSGYSIKILAPFITWPKWRIAGTARELKVPIHETWSCYTGGAKPCGTCPACVKLAKALELS